MPSSGHSDRAIGIAGATLLLLALLAGEGFTFFSFGLSCALAENVEPGSLWDTFCQGPWVWLPALGAVAALLGYGSLVVGRNERGFWSGVVFAVVLGVALWIVWGDPAGNFAGLVR